MLSGQFWVLVECTRMWPQECADFSGQSFQDNLYGPCIFGVRVAIGISFLMYPAKLADTGSGWGS